MIQVVNVTFYGFVSGKYTYFWKKKELYRQAPNKNIKKILLGRYGGSFRYKIQGDYYDSETLSILSYRVKVREVTPF